jgi:hypothetical protein
MMNDKYSKEAYLKKFTTTRKGWRGVDPRELTQHDICLGWLEQILYSCG